MAETVRVPVRECVGAAMRFVVDNARFVATAALIAAAAVTALAAIALALPLMGLLTGLASSFVRAFFYAALLGAALFGVAEVRGRLVNDGWRVWAAMAVIGFFMFIVMFVLLIPGAIVMFAGPLAPYLDELRGAGQEQAAVLEVMTRFATEQPLAVLLFCLFYTAVWLLLTSCVYPAAPATVDHKRILTFETWRATRGNVLPITWARIMLLTPAYVLVSALDYIVARLANVEMLDPVAAAELARSNPVAYLVYVFATSFITFAVYTPLEAGLSTTIYRHLKPALQLQPAP